MDTLINFLSLLGGLGMFLYGMKIMSDGLEKFAGERLRSILAAMTKNRVMGVLTGILITAIIQSSSATTVMVVSFVNAGLMTLTQSIGVIMGANIGTTVTAWIISAVGFKVDMASFAVPLISAGALLVLFCKKDKQKNIGQFILGFSLLFIGLSFLQKYATLLNIGEAVANMLATMDCNSFATILLFVLVGAVVTAIVQASAATMAITLLLFDMHIPGFGFEQAAALAMGQNIGTTITAYIASFTGNTLARRTAMAHLFFNVFGVVVFLMVFYPACNAVSWMVTDVLGAENNDLFKLSAFHTAFNIINTLLLIGFVPQIEKLVCRLVPQKGEQEEEFRLKYISGGLFSTPELSILEAKKEIGNFAQRCIRMFNLVKELLDTKETEDFNNGFARITKYEKITDNMEKEIANYLDKVGDEGLSNESKLQKQRMLKLISELESIGDSCFNLGRTLNHKRECKDEYTDEQYKHIQVMIEHVDKSLDNMYKTITRPETEKLNMDNTMNIERDMNQFRNLLKNQNLQDISDNKYTYNLGIHYMDFINECERLGDYVVNVVQASK
ncbi:MAG: Na/Pi cotransporter family protein [Bacteroidales bacterium]|nr:Na/Pi cotransporter family protein [Bacteroidales bacterium]